MTETPETHTTGSFNLKPIIHADLPSVQLQRDYEALAATAARSAARVAAQRRALTQIRDMATERQREGSTFAGLRHIRVLAEAALAEEETAEEDAPGIPSEVRAGYYRHYKGQYYLLFGLAHHSETMKLMAVYVALYLASGPRMAVRPAELFFDEVCLAEGHLPNHVGRPSNADCKMAPRFVYVGLEVPAESVAG